MEINVGGSVFHTSRETLELCGSMLRCLVNYEEPPLFVDRDADTFRDVLCFARSGVIRRGADLDCLWAEADFFCNDALKEAVESERGKKRGAMERMCEALERMERRMG